MKIALLSPYHGGSHRAWAEGYRAHSRHEIHLLSLPARFWKWRMHGGAVTLARRFLDDSENTELLLATDMLDLSTFLALTRRRVGAIPSVLFMHENQLTYPLPEEPGTGAMRRQLGERDRHYAFINYASMLVADRVVFNSAFHRDSFFRELPKFLNHFPEHNELGSVEPLRKKSEVLAVGIDCAALTRGNPSPSNAAARDSNNSSPPLVLWNQRWEYDKNPAEFFEALYAMADAGVEFRLALCGERFSQRPAEFDEGIDRLGERIEHVGFADPEKYGSLLWQASVTVSTASHEFFGVSVLEAIFCETFPVLPRRLSYPELIPAAHHWRCLYNDHEGLSEKLEWALRNPREAVRFTAEELAPAARAFDWPAVAARYDALLEEI